MGPMSSGKNSDSRLSIVSIRVGSYVRLRVSNSPVPLASPAWKFTALVGYRSASEYPVLLMQSQVECFEVAQAYILLLCKKTRL